MTDIDVLRADLVSLKSARAAGLKSMMFRTGEDERRIEFKTDSEMVAAIAALERDIAALEGRGSVRTVMIRSSKGW